MKKIIEVEISKKYKLREDGSVIDIKTGFVKEITKTKRGYRIAINGKEYAIHQLVMQYFGEPCPNEHYIITHINGNLYDNRIENLKWTTRSEVKCTLPEGLRKCDFDSEAAYNKKRAEIHRSKCREEDNKKRRERYAADEEYRIKEQNKAKKYQKDNYEKCVDRQKRWAICNPEKYKAKRKRWKIKNREYESQKSIEYHKRNKDKTNYNQRVYYQVNKDEINERRRKKKAQENS